MVTDMSGDTIPANARNAQRCAVIEIIGTSAMEVLDAHTDTVRHIMEFVPYDHLSDLMQAALVEGLKVLDTIAEMEERRYAEQFDPDGSE